jgi:hypothetical protein
VEHLHHHTLSNILFDGISEAHCAWILSSFGPKVGVWLTIWLIFLAFWWSSPILFIVFRRQFGLPHPLLANIPQCMCTHLIDLMGPLLMMCSWQRTHGNPWCSSWHLCCHYTRCWFPRGMKTTRGTSFNHVQLFLSTSWHCVHQRWHLHLS